MKKKQGDLSGFIKADPKAKAAKAQPEEEKEVVVPDLKSTPAGEFPLFDDFVDGLCTWKPHFEAVVKTKTFSGLYTFLKNEYKSKRIYPPVDLIFNAFRLTPVNKIKVVVVGQDPYHQPGQAMGLCFSVPRGVKIPSSLQNIYKSIANDPKISGFTKPTHGDLSKWATQGVFLLNTILTVEDSKADSHRKSGWDDFTDHVINVLNKECDGLVFLLWGLPAQKKAKNVNATKHHVLKTSHPSGLSYTKGFDKAFHFSQCNEILKKMGKTEINWNVD